MKITVEFDLNDKEDKQTFALIEKKKDIYLLLEFIDEVTSSVLYHEGEELTPPKEELLHAMKEIAYSFINVSSLIK